MFDSVVIPQVPDAVTKYVNTWTPDKDARMHMKGQTPLWVPNVPFDVLAKEYPAITNEKRVEFAERILQDSIHRFGFPMALGDLMHVECAKPTWDFRWPDAPNLWRLAPQETTLAHVVWALKNGSSVSGAMGLLGAQFLAYQLHGWWDPAAKNDPAKWYDPKFEMTPSEWSELRNGGNASMNYGTAGRHRMVRGCIDYAVHGLEALHYLKIYDGAAHEYLTAKLAWHVNNLYEKFPLIDAPRGDHFGPSTPFVSVYQTAALRHILRKASSIANAASKIEKRAFELCHRIDELLIEYGPVVSSDENAPLHQWWYDIPYKDGKPRKVVVGEPGAQVNDGVSSVAAYLVPLLYEAYGTRAGDLYDAMLSDAKAKNFPVKYPAETAWMFGRVTL